jgi:hypothetical protein
VTGQPVTRWVLLCPPGMTAVAEVMALAVPPERVITSIRETEGLTDYWIISADLLSAFNGPEALPPDGQCPNC